MSEEKTFGQQLTRHLLFEVPSILIAVLLAISLSSWKQEKDIEESMQFSLQLVIEDLTSFQGLGEAGERNHAFNLTLEESIVSGDMKKIEENLYQFGIFEVDANSWELFKGNTTYLNRMDPRFLRDIEELISEFNLLENATERYRSFLFDHDPDLDMLKLAKYHLQYRKQVVFRSKEVFRKFQIFKEEYPEYF